VRMGAFVGNLLTVIPRLWKNLPDFSSLAESDVAGDSNRSTLSFFSMLHTASEIRRKILEVKFVNPVVSF
jgi:hypothetical protein